MPIFARRVLQEMLDENAKCTSPLVADGHIDRLNRRDRDSLAAEWEVAIAYGLSQLGQVQFEQPNRSGRKPDIQFTAETIHFVADVTSVGDAGVRKRNPTDEFLERFHQQLITFKLLESRFEITIGSRYEGEGRSRRKVAALPGRNALDEFIRSKIAAFLRAVAKEPTQPKQFVERQAGVDVTVAHVVGQPGVTAFFASYDTPQSLTHNPLYGAIKSKAGQLRAGYGTKVVFLCDGGSASLRNRAGGTGVSTDRIVRRCLADHAIDAICLVTIEQQRRSSFDPQGQLYLVSRPYFHPQVSAAGRASMTGLFARLAEVIPAPEAGPMRVLQEYRWSRRPEGRSFWGACQMESKSVRLSARGVLELLAGNVSQEKFVADHGFANGKAANPIASMLAQGYLIDRVETERARTADDDWLVFHLRGPDVAVSEFGSHHRSDRE